MARNVRQGTTTQHYPIPYAFLNSTIAMIMACAGFVVHDLLVARGVFGFNAIVCLMAITFSLLIVYLWPRFAAFQEMEKMLPFAMGVQWCWVAYAISSLYFGSNHVTHISISIGVAAIIWKLVRQRNNKWISTAVFSFFGVTAMGLTIWQGLDDWSMSATAKLKVTSRNQAKETTKNFLRSPMSYSSPERPTKQWSYEGETGPAMWGQLRPEFKQCASGLNQSPIDIPRHAFLSRDWVRNTWRSESGHFVVEGETVRVDLSGKTLFEVDKKNYRVKQLYLHSPSEHQLSGLSYPMEIQLMLEGSSGVVLGVAAFVEIGEANPEFGKIVASLQGGAISHPMEDLKVASLFPDDFSAYRYPGSLTVPPCTEGLSWNVLRTPVEFSAEQVMQFRKMFSGNSRPIQSFGLRKFEVSSPQVAH